MYRFLVAYKYIVSRLLTFAGLFVVTIGVAVLVVVVSVMEGFRSELERRIRGTASDVRVESKVLIGLRDPERLEKAVEALPEVESAVPVVETLALYRPRRRFLIGLAVTDREAEDRYLTAVDFSDPVATREVDSWIAAVEYPDLEGGAGGLEAVFKEVFASLPRDHKGLFSPEWLGKGLWKPWVRHGGEPPPELPPPVIVGVESFRRELLLPGDTVELTSFSPVQRRAVSGEFLVAGYFKTGLYELDAKGILMRLEDAERFLGLRGSDGALRVSGLRITLKENFRDGEALALARKKIDEVLRKLDTVLVRTQTWRESRAPLLQQVKVEKFIVSLSLGLVILFAGFMIFIILTVQVVEKYRDIGVLQSLGATPRGIAAIFFAIGLTLCIGGMFLGGAYGVAFGLSINTIQRWVTLLTGLEVFPSDVFYLDRIPVRFKPLDLLFIVVPTVAGSLLASVVPALRAARKEPQETLRYE